MAILGWLKFRDKCRFHLFCITHNAIYMRVPEYLSKRVIIRATTRPSRKCELMKLSLHSHLCMQILLSQLLIRSTGIVFPMTYVPYHIFVLSNVDYIHICCHYNVLFYNILLFVYLFILLCQLDAYKRLSFHLYIIIITAAIITT